MAGLRGSFPQAAGRHAARSCERARPADTVDENRPPGRAEARPLRRQTRRSTGIARLEAVRYGRDSARAATSQGSKPCAMGDSGPRGSTATAAGGREDEEAEAALMAVHRASPSGRAGAAWPRGDGTAGGSLCREANHGHATSVSCDRVCERQGLPAARSAARPHVAGLKPRHDESTPLTSNPAGRAEARPLRRKEDGGTAHRASKAGDCGRAIDATPAPLATRWYTAAVRLRTTTRIFVYCCSP